MKRMRMLLAMLMVFCLFAVPAFAVITGSKHDLSSTMGAGVYGATDTDEKCVFCHTPHEASTATTKAPLWNRTVVAVTAGNTYTGPSGTLDAVGITTTTAGMDETDYNATDVGLCLSCHDGSSMTSTALVNPPNNTGALDWDTTAGASGEINTTADLGTDLTNDHPIGFTYDAALIAADGELDSVVNITSDFGDNPFFGSGNDEMWCSSCHDVHGVAGAEAFLRISNAGSALCLACHLK